MGPSQIDGRAAAVQVAWVAVGHRRIRDGRPRGAGGSGEHPLPSQPREQRLTACTPDATQQLALQLQEASILHFTRVPGRIGQVTQRKSTVFTAC
jgi:hypothetical protein